MATFTEQKVYAMPLCYLKTEVVSNTNYSNINLLAAHQLGYVRLTLKELMLF